jgi:hypothetical protein
MLLAQALAAIVLSSALLQCSEEQLTLDTVAIDSSSTYDLDVDGSTEINDCLGCTYVVPADARVIDGAALGLKPGSVIGLSSKATYGQLLFKNIVGTLDNPIIIRNCGGIAHVDGTDKGYAINTQKSEYFRITGGDTKNFYGIVLTGGNMGLNLSTLSNHFEVDHLEIQNSGFAGIMAKTDPSCDEATWRVNFLMKGIALHNNFIHDTGGEGIYAGNSFFMGMNTPCGVKLPHEIHYIRIYSNILRNTGWEAIQLGCATKGASIHANVIENYGTANQKAQNNGMQIGAGTGGVCYNNLIRGGTGNGLIVMGLGDNLIYNNIIDQAGNYGIFCDERYSPGPGFKFINNTILNPKSDGIRIYADLVSMNVIVNNIVTNPGSYYAYSYPRTPDDAFIYKLNNEVKTTESNNYFSLETTPLQTSSVAEFDYRLTCTSAVIDKGADISAYGIKTDFYYKPRYKGAFYDIGAVEQ